MCSQNSYMRLIICTINLFNQMFKNDFFLSKFNDKLNQLLLLYLYNNKMVQGFIIISMRFFL